MKKRSINTILKVTGWLLVLITVGPIGFIGKELVTLDKFSFVMLVPVGIFGSLFTLGVWLIKRKRS